MAYESYFITQFEREKLKENLNSVLESDFYLDYLFQRNWLVASHRIKIKNSLEFPLDKCPDTYYDQGYYLLNHLFLEDNDDPVPEDDWWNC